MPYVIQNHHGQILQSEFSGKTWDFPKSKTYSPELIENLDRAVRLAEITDAEIKRSDGIHIYPLELVAQ